MACCECIAVTQGYRQPLLGGASSHCHLPDHISDVQLQPLHGGHDLPRGIIAVGGVGSGHHVTVSGFNRGNTVPPAAAVPDGCGAESAGAGSKYHSGLEQSIVQVYCTMNCTTQDAM